MKRSSTCRGQNLSDFWDGTLSLERPPAIMSLTLDQKVLCSMRAAMVLQWRSVWSVTARLWHATERTCLSTVRQLLRLCSSYWLMMECRTVVIARTFSMTTSAAVESTQDSTKTLTLCHALTTRRLSSRQAMKIPLSVKWTNSWRKKWHLTTCQQTFADGNRTLKFRCRVTEQSKQLLELADSKMEPRKS